MLCAALCGSAPLRAQEVLRAQGVLPAPVVVPETLVEPPRATEPPAIPVAIRQRRWELIWGGIGALTLTWAADRFLAHDLSSDWKPWLPVVGPWFLLSQQQQLVSPSTLTSTLLVIDGLAQASGVVLITLGGVLTRPRVTFALPAAKH